MDAETFKDIIPNPSAISSILTLRYNPIQTPSLPKLCWNDFVPKNDFTSIRQLKKMFLDSINEKISDVNPNKIGVALSGGVDSTLAIALLRENYPEIKIHALSLKFKDSKDETSSAAKIADKFNADHQTIYLEKYLEELPKAISIVKQPFWDLHWYYVAKTSSSYSQFLASGDGGDELFGGYTFRYEKFLSKVSNKTPALDKVKAYLTCHERDHVPDQEKLFSKNIKFSWDNIHEFLLPYFDNPLTPLTQVFLADYNGKLLYNFEPINSAICNFFGLRQVTPLLSKQIISFATHIPENLKYDTKLNQGKILLRRLLQELKADTLISNEKYGFSVNTSSLWNDYAKKLCQDMLYESNIVKEGWINEDWIRHHLERDELEIRYINKFLGLLALEIWYKLFVTKDINPNTKL